MWQVQRHKGILKYKTINRKGARAQRSGASAPWCLGDLVAALDKSCFSPRSIPISRLNILTVVTKNSSLVI